MKALIWPLQGFSPNVLFSGLKLGDTYNGACPRIQWAAYMYKLEFPAASEEALRRMVRRDDMVFQHGEFTGEESCLDDLHEEEDYILPYLEVYDKIRQEKSIRNLKKVSTWKGY